MTTFLTLGLHLIGKIRFTESKVTSDPDPYQSQDSDPSSRMRIRGSGYGSETLEISKYFYLISYKYFKIL